MANFIGPYWTRINYHSLLAPHTMQICTKNWSPGAGTGDFDTWAAGTINATVMIEALVGMLLPFFNTGVIFDNWQIMKQLLPADVPIPVSGGNFSGFDGTEGSGGWAAATQLTITAHTVAFGLAKIVLLDCCSFNTFTPYLTPDTKITDLFIEWNDPTNGWAGRDNAQIGGFLKGTITLNEKLRKEYRYD